MTTKGASNETMRTTLSQLTGADLWGVARAFHVALEQNYEILNALNVFPVPDGDTGTNMRLTVRGVWQDLEGKEGATVGDIASTMARSALLGARGNSGVILSQFFAGLAKSLSQLDAAGSAEVAGAFGEATTAAYSAVGNPTEGTMLTVIREASAADQAAAATEGADVLTIWEAASREAAASVLRPCSKKRALSMPAARGWRSCWRPDSAICGASLLIRFLSVRPPQHRSAPSSW
jgi:hypothetical protein